MYSNEQLNGWELKVCFALFTRAPTRRSPMTNQEIAAAAGVPRGPTLRTILHRLRVEGRLPGLCAGTRGYYFATSPEELREYLQSLKHRAVQILALHKATKKSLERYDGQPALFGETA